MFQLRAVPVVPSVFSISAVVSFERKGLDAVAPVLLAIADAEGLDAHARALRIRLEP